MRLLYISICRLPFISQNDFISLYIFPYHENWFFNIRIFSNIRAKYKKKKKRLQKYKFKIKAFLDLFWSNVTNSSQQLLYSQFRFPLKKQPNSSCNKKYYHKCYYSILNFSLSTKNCVFLAIFFIFVLPCVCYLCQLCFCNSKTWKSQIYLKDTVPCEQKAHIYLKCWQL